MGILEGLLATIVIIGGIAIVMFLVAWFQNYKASFQQKYHRSFYHFWAISSWMALPISFYALSAGVSGAVMGSQLWYGWVPVFSLLGAYWFYMKKYGLRAGFMVITLQLIPACLAIRILIIVIFIGKRIFDRN